jgi:uncharacterized protein (DUF488 family)
MKSLHAGSTLQKSSNKKIAPREVVFYTLGYEQSDPEEFVRRLQEHGVTRVVDVRAVPLSRKKGFSKNQLQAILADAHIDYFHMQTLGAPKTIRDELMATGSWWTYTKKYIDQILSSRQEDVDVLISMAKKEKISLLCFERNPRECHRSLVALEMEKRGNGSNLRVEHIEY